MSGCDCAELVRALYAIATAVGGLGVMLGLIAIATCVS